MYFDHLYKMPDGPCSKVELPYSWRPETPWTRMFAQHSGIPARGPPGSGLEAWHLSTPETTIQKPLQPPAGASVPPIAVGYGCSHLDLLWLLKDASRLRSSWSSTERALPDISRVCKGFSQTSLSFALCSDSQVLPLTIQPVLVLRLD